MSAPEVIFVGVDTDGRGGVFENGRLLLAEVAGRRYVTNGHWQVALTCLSTAKPANTESEWTEAAGPDAFDLLYVGRLDRASRPMAVWRSSGDPSFQVLIAWRYHLGLELENQRLRTVGPTNIIAVFAPDEKVEPWAYLMPCRNDERTEEAPLILEAEAAVAPSLGDEGGAP